MIIVKDVSFSSAAIIASFVTPQTALAAPAAGYTRNILGITHAYTKVTTAYTVASAIYYNWNAFTSVPNFLDNWSLQSGASRTEAVQKYDGKALVFSTKNA